MALPKNWEGVQSCLIYPSPSFPIFNILNDYTIRHN